MSEQTKEGGMVTVLPLDGEEPARTNGSALAVRADEPMVMDIRRSLPQAKAQFEAIREFVKDVLVEAVPADKDRGIEAKDGDYGTVPGIAKPFLFKSGAEKIASLFGYAPVYVTLEKIEDFGERKTNGFFFYRYRCDLVSKKTGTVMGSGIGSCNSMEDKYRWEQKNRVCPNCKKETIIKGRAEFGGGWVCWSRREVACGSKWPDGAAVIEGQSVERIERETFSLVNTIDKMAQKRALVAAVLIGTGTSALFTQDEETVESSGAAKPAAKAAAPAATTGTTKPAEPNETGSFWREATYAEGQKLFRAESENGDGRSLKSKELPAGCKYDVRRGHGKDGKDLFVKMVDASIHGPDPTVDPTPPPASKAEPAAVPEVAEAPVVAQPMVRDLDAEIAHTLARCGFTVARIQVAARRVGASDGDWKKLPTEKKERWLGALLDTANQATATA